MHRYIIMKEVVTPYWPSRNLINLYHLFKKLVQIINKKEKVLILIANEKNLVTNKIDSIPAYILM